MSVSLSSFGALFLVAICASFLFRPRLLWVLLAVAAVMQAPSPLVFEFDHAYGLSAFLLAALAVVLRSWRRPIGPAAVMRELRGLPPGMQAWIAFFAVSLASTVIGPTLFSGLLVYAPLNKLGVDAEMAPLQWSLNHLAQAANVGLIAGLFVAVWPHRADAAFPRLLMLAVVVAAGVALVAGLQQRLAWNGHVPMWAEFWATNPTYTQDYQSSAGPVPRVNWPFADPAYASTFFAACFGGFFTTYLANLHRDKSLLGVVASLFALANTLGATGLLAATAFLMLCASVTVALSLRHPRLSTGLLYRVALASIAATCIALGVVLVLRHYELQATFVEAAQNVLAGRSQTLLGDLRPHADLQSLRLVVESWGLGVGLGSHRGSSYLTTLAANGGLLGLACFLLAIALHFTSLAKRFRAAPDAPSAFFLGGGFTVFLAVSMAIPDQSWPVFWIFILGGWACVLCPGAAAASEVVVPVARESAAASGRRAEVATNQPRDE